MAEEDEVEAILRRNSLPGDSLLWLRPKGACRMACVLRGERLAAVLRMSRSPGLLTDASPLGHTPLHAAALAGNESAVASLVDEGVPVDLRDAHGRTALCCVFAQLSKDADGPGRGADRELLAEVERFGCGPEPPWAKLVGTGVALLDRGASLAAECGGATVFDVAVPAIVLNPQVPYSMLNFVFAYVDVGQRDGDGLTPLMHAAISGAEKDVSILMSRGADPGAACLKHNRSALHYAVLSRNVMSIGPLARVCCAAALDKEWQRPIDIARRTNAPRLVMDMLEGRHRSRRR